MSQVKELSFMGKISKGAAASEGSAIGTHSYAMATKPLDQSTQPNGTNFVQSLSTNMSVKNTLHASTTDI